MQPFEKDTNHETVRILGFGSVDLVGVRERSARSVSVLQPDYPNLRRVSVLDTFATGDLLNGQHHDSEVAVATNDRSAGNHDLVADVNVADQSPARQLTISSGTDMVAAPETDSRGNTVGSHCRCQRKRTLGRDDIYR